MAPKLVQPPPSRAVKYSAGHLAEYMKTLDWHEKHVHYERAMQMHYGFRYRRALAAALSEVRVAVVRPQQAHTTLQQCGR